MKIQIRSPTFLSEVDEELFFLGLRLVASVRRYEGIGRLIEIHLDPKAPAEAARDLTGLFRRFGVRTVPTKKKEGAK